MDQEMDNISHLPEPLIDKILSLIPIRDAVRTSILSSNWRFKWTTLSNLVFDDKLFDTHRSTLGVVKIIDRVLLLHSGPVQKFMLSLKCSIDNADIDIWLRVLSKASMIELILDLSESGPRYKVPSSMFYCDGLTSLRLCHCSVSLPVSPTFRGFKNLKILYLRSVALNDTTGTLQLEKLISGSDVLEELSLISYNIHGFNYVAPKLKHFCCRGSLIGFGFGVRFNTTFCSPSFHMEFHESTTIRGSINLFKFFAPLRSVETLKLDGDVLKCLSVEEVPAMLAEPFLLLKNLFISGVNFKSVKELLVILCLLRSAPNIKQLKLLAAENGNHVSEDIVEVDHDCSGIEICTSPSTFGHLNSVSLSGIGDSVLEMAFIGILLSSSPTLQKMTIKATKSSRLGSSSERGEYKLLKNMIRFLSPSTQVEVIFV